MQSVPELGTPVPTRLHSAQVPNNALMVVACSQHLGLACAFNTLPFNLGHDARVLGRNIDLGAPDDVEPTEYPAAAHHCLVFIYLHCTPTSSPPLTPPFLSFLPAPSYAALTI